MSEETQTVACTAFVASACVAIVFFFARCATALNQTAETRRTEEIKSEERLAIERTKNGFEYVPQGAWIKRRTDETLETKQP